MALPLMYVPSWSTWAATSAAAKVIDPRRASRMMWFDKENQRVLFGDIRDEEHLLCDSRVLKVKPDVLMDFRSLPLGTPSGARSCSTCRTHQTAYYCIERLAADLWPEAKHPRVVLLNERALNATHQAQRLTTLSHGVRVGLPN